MRVRNRKRENVCVFIRFSAACVLVCPDVHQYSNFFFQRGIMGLLISFHLSQCFHRGGFGKKPGFLGFMAVPQDQFLIY